MASPSKKGLNVRTICNALGSLKSMWFQIGIQLGIPRYKLKEFKEDPDPLSAVVDYWLRGNVTESTVPITWKSIVATLKSDYIDEPGLAVKISAEYCKDQLQESQEAEDQTGKQEFKSAESSRQLKEESEELLQQQITGNEYQIQQLQSEFDQKIQLLNEKAFTTKSQFQQLQNELDQKIQLLHDKNTEIQQLQSKLAAQHTKKINPTTNCAAESDGDVHEYYDIVLVGKIRIGKSTLGNKLLNISGTPETKIRLFEDEDIHSFPPTHLRIRKKCFVQANDPEVIACDDYILSVTDKCKLMANDSTKIRVLDVPGFSDSIVLEKVRETKVSVREGNLQIIRTVARAQILFQLKVRRVVYFLPQRGSLEKADGMLREELKVLYHFFGKEIFDCMVIAATTIGRKKIQELGFDADDFKQTTHIIKIALKCAIPGENIVCPPLIYIGLNDNPEVCLSKVRGVSVTKEDILPLRHKVETCSRCSAQIHCSKENEKIAIVYPDRSSIPYAQSKCHPAFVQKYSRHQKVAGGASLFTLISLGQLVKRDGDQEIWPGFTNSDEICVVCKKSPGSLGCTELGREITYNTNSGTATVKVDHSKYI